MNVIFRVDAETSTIGTGHVIRCLNLAHELKKKKAEIHFLTRKFQGNLGNLISAKNYKLTYLKNKKISNLLREDKRIFKKKIQIQEAKETIKILKKNKKNLLIIDHYFLNKIYESFLKKHFFKIFVIDDLCNRKHNCDIILDQNYSRVFSKKYSQNINKKCIKLLGPKYALVDKKFSFFRKRKAQKEKKNRSILVFMGGSDPKKEILKAVSGITSVVPKINLMHVVVGKSFRYLRELRNELKKIKIKNKLYVQTKNMAKILSSVKLAILSGGTVTWEKCTLGIPSLVTVQSNNQAKNSYALEKKGAHIVVGKSERITSKNYTNKIQALSSKKIHSMSRISSKIYD